MNSEQADAFYALVEAKRGVIKTIGIILLLVGIIAISAPHYLTVSTELLIGWILLVSGGVHVFHAIGAKGWGGLIWQVLIGIIQGGAGLFLLFSPENGIITLTVLLAVLFIGEGIIRSFFAFSLQPRPAWKWVLASGLVSLVVGVLTFANMPSSATWAIGLLVGCNIAMAGWILIVIATAVKKD